MTENQIALNVPPIHAESVFDKPIFLSFLMPDMDKLNNDVTTDFCHFVFFFDSKSVAE